MEAKLGEVLIQVQDDLRQLKCSLEKITINERGATLDVQALDNAIRKTESSIKKHAEDYQKTANKQLLVLPSIEDVQKKKVLIPKWKPALESIPDVRPQRQDLLAASPGEKHKSVTMRLLRNPTHPNNRAIMHEKFGISLPVVHKRSITAAKHPRKIAGPVVSLQAIEPKGRCGLAVPEEEMGTVPDKSLLQMSVQHKVACLHLREKIGQLRSKSRNQKQLKWETEPGSTCERTSRECSPCWTTIAPPPSATSKNMDDRSVVQSTNSLIPESPQSLPAPENISRYPFTVIKGWINPMATDFCHFKQSFILCWSSVTNALEALEKLLRDYAVPRAKVSGERLVEFGHVWNNGWKTAPPGIGLLSVLENWEEVLSLVLRPGQRYKGEGGINVAAICIQSCWRRYLARTAYLRHCRRKWAAGTIAISWLMHAQMRRVRRALQARRFRQLENYRSRAQHLAANWKHIQSSKRTIIHIPSLGYSQSQRLSLRGFDILQNTQISRLCDIRDDKVQVIYVCPRHLGEDILHYYTNLLKCDGPTDRADTGTTQASSCIRRFVIITPEAVDYFPIHNMCLSTLLKYSPRTLKRIRHLIQGKQAYIVGGVAHVDDLAVADELGVPILGPEPAVAQLYSTKSGGRRIFVAAEVDVSPGQGDIYSLNQESVLLRYLDEIPEWLTRYAQPAKPSCYPNWACFLKTFLRQGGVVEAYPPSDSVTCLTVDLLLEPGGEVTMLSCGDQLHGSCHLETVGSTVPQTSVNPETLRSICMRVGQACLQRLIVGYVSVDLATFVDHNTMEQRVWAIDLDLTYSDQLAMTQMLLMMTGGTLNWHAGCLEVPMPVREKCCEHQIAAKPPVVHRYAVLGSRLFHSNLSMLYHSVFLKMCKAHGIGFNMKRKQGTVFALYDSSERCSIGLIAVSEDLQGALVTFARNLSVIHQEISASKMQGETNFKELIKEVEEVLQMIAQNKFQALEERSA
ncbi:IQ motif-containing protein H isoform X4 [Sparus aurata]|uniref:IQ motif-containing protein H isoform X4 n=1 Tax=Sparus aurata TaxID=8175 RepID=UPI0011C18424|nr:IQ domain-containing protein H isoform X4 [Sparus aurata]